MQYTTKGESGQKGSPFFSSKSQSDHFSRRPLMTAREVMELSREEEIVLVGGAKPIKCQKSLYYVDGNFIPLTDEENPLEVNRDSSIRKTNEWLEYSSRFEEPEEEPSESAHQLEQEIIKVSENAGLVITEDESENEEFDDEEIFA